MEVTRKLLSRVTVNDDVFNDILESYAFKVRVVDNIHDYYHGYKDKSIIYYNGTDTLICREFIVYGRCNSKTPCTEWKQVRVEKVMNQKSEMVTSLSGTQAKAYVNRMLLKHYTETEIDERLHMFEAEYDKGLRQMHYNFNKLDDPDMHKKIYAVDNVYKFDINGAHLNALCEIFPKAKDEFLRMYNMRKKNPIFKQYPNLYVGCLAAKTNKMRKDKIPGKYEKTYNWIVQRTTNLLATALEKLNGRLIYANTDGAMVQAPKTIINTSKELGDFKLEFSGKCYIYHDRNYIIYQFGEDKVGTCFTSVRKDIDLAKGQVVHYTQDYILIDGKIAGRKPANIIKETLQIYED